jgi:hypothetical protein
VSTVDLAQMLAQYRAGLEAQITLLHQLEAVADHQRTISEARDFELLAAESERRDALMRSLFDLENGLHAQLLDIGAPREALKRLEALPEVRVLRRITADMVARILETDQLALQALANADLARRTALASLDRGETTLAAYRKVLTPSADNAPLVDRVG